jgi:hypothetical protein
MRILLGNVLFGLLMLVWYRRFHGEQPVMLAGVLLAFFAFVFGAFTMYLLHPAAGPRTGLRRPRRYTVPVDASAFDRIA